MSFKPKPTRNKVLKTNKTLYISDELIAKIDQIAIDNDTSFNNVVVSIIEDFFTKEEAEN